MCHYLSTHFNKLLIIKTLTMDKEIKFKYIFSEDYNPRYSNGAYGGITPKGEIAVNFYFERPGLPRYQSYEINEKGKLGKETARNPEDLQTSMVRFVENGVILDINSAKNIVDWLNEKIVSLEKMRNDQKESKKE